MIVPNYALQLYITIVLFICLLTILQRIQNMYTQTASDSVEMQIKP